MTEELFPSGTAGKKAPVFIVAGVAALVLAAVAIMYLQGGSEPMEFEQSDIHVVVTPQASAPEEESLGGALYEKANNPLEEKLPEATPMANPIEDAYKNPF